MHRIERVIAVSALLAGFGSYSQAPAQVHEAWAAAYDGPGGGFDKAADLAMDGAGNVYVTGVSDGGGPGGVDYATVKYDANGNQLWEKRYDGPAGSWDGATALAVDVAGNVHVTGTSFSSSPSFPNDYATIKYDTNGNQLWVRRFNGVANSFDDAYAIGIDSSGNCYVTGSSRQSGVDIGDIVTIKYDAAGNELWVRNYDGPAGGSSTDWGKALVVDGLGSVFVTGFSENGTYAEDMITIKYDTNGVQEWVSRYDGGYPDIVNAIALDGAGNVYVTGQSDSSIDYDYMTIKYDPSGLQQWAVPHDGGAWDYGNDLVVDGAGNTIVTGWSQGVGATTIMYDPGGMQLWLRTSGREGNAIAVGGSGAIYVTGIFNQGWPNRDYLTVKYDPLGNELWTITYEGPSDDMDIAGSLVLDANENVYVTGFRTSGSEDYLTIKYVQELGGEYCFGDGSADPCPCSNPGAAGEGCAHSGGTGGRLASAGSDSASADDLRVFATRLPPGQPALLFAGENAVNGGQGIPFGDGLRCAGMHVVRLGTRTPDANGNASWGPGLGAAGGWGAGDSRYFQTWYRDPSGPCGAGFNLTNGVELTLTS